MNQDSSTKPLRHHEHLPDAFERFDELLAFAKANDVVLCLDYDGTLSPIVENPKDAVMSDEMRQRVKNVAQHLPVAIVSGRGLEFIRQQVALDEVYYAGSHGFEITGPNDFQHELPEAKDALPLLDATEKELNEQLASIDGAEVERKKFGIAIHYRRVEKDQRTKVKQAVQTIADRESQLQAGRGKMVLELKPNIDWHKGKAIHFIADHLSESEQSGPILYIGDDITDEDAFRAIKTGAGVLVGSHDEDSAADYRLKDVAGVADFLQKLNENLHDG